MAPPLPTGGIPINGGGLFITRPPNKSRLELGPEDADDVGPAPPLPNKSIEGVVAGGGVGGAGRLDDVVEFDDPAPNAEEKSANPTPALFPVLMPAAGAVVLLVLALFETFIPVPNADSKSPKSPLGLLLAFIVSLPRGLKSSSSS